MLRWNPGSLKRRIIARSSSAVVRTLASYPERRATFSLAAICRIVIRNTAAPGFWLILTRWADASAPDRTHALISDEAFTGALTDGFVSTYLLPITRVVLASFT